MSRSQHCQNLNIAKNDKTWYGKQPYKFHFVKGKPWKENQKLTSKPKSC